jgi:hypothetical protein
MSTGPAVWGFAQLHHSLGECYPVGNLGAVGSCGPAPEAGDQASDRLGAGGGRQASSERGRGLSASQQWSPAMPPGPHGKALFTRARRWGNCRWSQELGWGYVQAGGAPWWISSTKRRGLSRPAGKGQDWQLERVNPERRQLVTLAGQRLHPGPGQGLGTAQAGRRESDAVLRMWSPEEGWWAWGRS